MLLLLIFLIPTVLAVGMPGVGMEPPPPPSQGEPQFGPGRSDFANGPPQSNFQPEPLDQPPPPPSQGGPQFEPGRSDFANGPPQSNFQPEPPVPQQNFRPQQGAPMQADFGGGSPFDNQNRPPPDYGNMGDYDGGDGAGPAGPLSRYLSPLRRFFNPITRHHFVHSDPVVMMRNIGGTGAPTHFIIPVPTYNRNQEVIDQLCPFLVRLHSMKMGGAQLLVSNPFQHRRGKMMGWRDNAPAGMCSKVRGACGANVPIVAARRTNLDPDFIHFVTRIEMNQYLMTHRNFVPSGRGAICWVWR